MIFRSFVDSRDYLRAFGTLSAMKNLSELKNGFESECRSIGQVETVEIVILK